MFFGMAFSALTKVVDGGITSGASLLLSGFITAFLGLFAAITYSVNASKERIKKLNKYLFIAFIFALAFIVYRLIKIGSI